MAGVLEKGQLFDPKVSAEIFSKVKGHSSIAKLHGASPIPFNGEKVMTFSMDKEVDIVAESGAKSNGGVTLAPVVIAPIKIEYGARVSDEFLNAEEEEQLDILESWIEGFAKKAARALDLMGVHGINPRTGLLASQIIGSNSFDTNENVKVVTFDPDTQTVEDALTKAVEEIGDYDATGYAFSKKFGGFLGKYKENGVSQYPEFKLGGNPGKLNGTACDVNNTISVGNEDYAVVGDFANAFKWGMAKDIFFKVIEYGNPDNDAEAGDLQGHNQVYIRSEAYIGWGILDPTAFAVIKKPVSPSA